MAEHHETVLDFLDNLFQTANDKFTATVAAGAMLVPMFQVDLRHTSETAALLAPILGCAWLIIQIVAKLWSLAAKREGEG